MKYARYSDLDQHPAHNFEFALITCYCQILIWNKLLQRHSKVVRVYHTYFRQIGGIAMGVLFRVRVPGYD